MLNTTTPLDSKIINKITDAGALGLYVYISSLPETNSFNALQAGKHFNCGETYLRARIKILKDLGILKSSPKKDSKGKIIKWVTILS